MFRPLGNYVLVLPIEVPDKTPSGIIIPETSKEKPNQGKVIEVGEGTVTDRGEKIPVLVKKDDTVLFHKFAGIELKLDNTKYLLLRDTDVYGVLS